MPQLRVLDKPLTCSHCGDPLLPGEGTTWLNEEEARHTRQCPPWRPAGPLSDGTLRCPHRREHLPCQRHIPAGWHENEGHAGGHWFAPDNHSPTGEPEHADASSMLALRPYDSHDPFDCTDPATCPNAPDPAP